MIHTETLDEIIQNRQQGEFLLPYYEKYSIAELAPSILSTFGVKTTRATFPPHILKLMEGYEKIVTFMMDGFGYRHFESIHGEFEFFLKMKEQGHIFPLTSVFPSTTPAALTTLHTGYTPQEHGLLEWYMYWEEMDAIVEALPFKKMHESERDSLLKAGGTAQMLFDRETLYENLAAQNVSAYVFIYHEYAASTYSQSTQKGSTVIPFVNGTDLMDKLAQTLKESPKKSYLFVYWNFIDVAEHSFGPGSREHLEALLEISNLLDSRFLDNFPKAVAKDTLVLMTADHGHTNITGEKIIYLNDYVDLEKNYKWGKSKNSILPTGAPHDVFLFIHEPVRDKMLAYLKEKLKGKAEILTTEEGLSRNLFGINKPSKKFLSRVGNLIILPYKNYHIWYRHKKDAKYELKGTHGGLSPEEMLVPLAIVPLDKMLYNANK